ncbi:hypothetical protein BASA60_000738 [Batrachochytrium salamandrivorans]|nr:hypothetical protein BASA62_002053 [Batrachochytrium salamandrivorans]KAH6584998.1 hypothetical protein BASA60_000738 [Batrachochytrium salamandrivorans]
MKLISFAAISLLAVTVSAYPGLGTLPQSTTTQSALQHQSTDTQSVQQYQDAFTQSVQQPDQDPFQTELSELEEDQSEQEMSHIGLDKLEKDYERTQVLISELGSIISTTTKEKVDLGLEKDELNEALKKNDINRAEKAVLLTEYLDKCNDWGENISF